MLRDPRPVPVLDVRTGTGNLDWPDAAYRVDTDPDGAGGWRVRHHLTGAAALRGLVASGDAAWAVEVRCPRTLYSELTYAPGERVTMTVPKRPEMNHGPVWFLPGIVARNDCVLATDELSDIWQGPPITAPAGTWLARGQPITKSAASSLLRFAAADDLAVGRMRIRNERDDAGHARLLIELHERQLHRSEQDAVFLAMAWAAALAHLPNIEGFEIPAEGDDTLAEPTEYYGQLLVRRLRSEGVALWDEAAWCPLSAATALVRLPEPEQPDEGE